MNQQSESWRQNIYVGVGVMKDYNLDVYECDGWVWEIDDQGREL